MSEPRPEGSGAARVRALFERKVRAELEDADVAAGGQAVPWAGDPLASIAAVKGERGPAERSGGEAFSGPDGEALRKALEALGERRSVFFACSALAGAEDAAAVKRIRAQLATVDPSVVVAVDEMAALVVAAAFGVRSLAPGKLVRVGSSTLLALDGLEASLADERRKARVWAQLRALAALIHEETRT